MAIPELALMARVVLRTIFWHMVSLFWESILPWLEKLVKMGFVKRLRIGGTEPATVPPHLSGRAQH